MALLKSKILPNGVTGNYWKVIKVTSSIKDKKMRCLLELFLDQAHADLPSPMGLGYVIPFDFSLTEQELSGELFSIADTKIKSVKNDIKIPAVEHRDAIAEVVADPDNGIVGSPAVPEVMAKPAVYKYPDLFGAVDA